MNLPACLVAAFAAVSLQEPEAVSPEQELEALIEKTNALESFRLVYDVEISVEGERAPGSMEVIYRSPDLGRVRLSGPDGEADVWLLEGTMYFQVEGTWRRASYPAPPAAGRLLAELFAPPLGPGVFLSLSGNANQAGGLNVSFGWGASGRSYVLGWLEAMRRRGGLTRDGSSLLSHSGEYEYRVSRQTGMLELAVISPASLHLREAQLDIELDPAVVTLPEEARKAEVDPGATRSLEASASPALLRETAFVRVERALASSQRPWDDRAREDWRSLLTVLYGDIFQEQFSTERERLEKRVDEKASWFRSRLKEDDSSARRAALETKKAESRRELEQLIDGGMTSATEALPPMRSKEIEPRQELFDIELEVIAAVWDEQMRKPLLESFDKKLEAALRP